MVTFDKEKKRHQNDSTLITSRSELQNSNEFENLLGDQSPRRACRSRNSDSSLLASNLTRNDEQRALLESAKDKLRMATIERKRMSSINAISGGAAG